MLSQGDLYVLFALGNTEFSNLGKGILEKGGEDFSPIQGLDFVLGGNKISSTTN